MSEEVKEEKSLGAEASGEGAGLDSDPVEPEGSEEKADDYIDELALKDKEVDYTEEDLVASDALIILLGLCLFILSQLYSFHSVQLFSRPSCIWLCFKQRG
jgi:hypothetical protein